MMVFTKRSRDHKISLIADATFLTPELIELGHVSQADNFWLSSHNVGEVAVIQIFQNYKESLVWSGHVVSNVVTLVKMPIFGFLVVMLAK